MNSPISSGANTLERYARDVFSQAGEDGVIEKILGTLPQGDRWCVEFGAWDGLHLSNTRNLVLNHGFSAVLIEADKARFAGLQRTYLDRPSVVTLNRWVASSAPDALDRILSSTPLPGDFDFLSIDIDGNDYHVWKALDTYRPKLVCIEFNPTIPDEVEFVQADDPKTAQGSSLLCLRALGVHKGYELACALAFNAFFVDARYFPLLGIRDKSLAALHTDRSHITYFFSGFDGRIFTRGLRKLPWHEYPFGDEDLQILPRMFRRFVHQYSPAQALAFELFKKTRNAFQRGQNLARRLLGRRS